MKTSLLPLLPILLLVAPAPSALADHHRSAKEDRVILFSGKNFSGEAIVVYSGDNIVDLNRRRLGNGKIANNRISSVKIEGDAVATLYDHRGFTGEALRITHSMRDLGDIDQDDGWGDWNNALSSIRVEERHRRSSPDRHRGDEYSDRRDDRGDRENPRRSGNNRDRSRNNDQVDDSSSGGYRYGRNDRGSRDDERYDSVGPVGTSRNSSDSRQPPRIREDYTQEVIRKAYRDVLGRAPDPSGLQTYTRAIRNRGWNEARVRADLRRSPEYREVRARRIVTQAYRDILKREPDPAGLSFYSQRVARGKWNDQRVRRALMNSPEYRNQPVHARSNRR